ncbi:ABC transporter ATP-binding protein, partial [Candidatus Saccharibacteria bacterium]|nr:ABC transporter ATP-binding protein [Candidatus Saccharibacteria bacterium]
MSELKKQNSSKKVIKFLFNLWKISPLPTWTMFTAQIIAVTLNMTVAPIFVSQLLTRIANGTANLDGSIWLLTGYALSLVVSIVILFNLIIGLSYISENKMQSAVDEKILHYLVSNSLTFHSNRMSGGIVSDTNKLIGSIERFWDTIVFNIIPITTTITTVCIVLSFIFWQYAVALAILSLIIITIVVFAQSRISPVSRIAADKSSKKTAYLADVIGNISAVKAFAMEKVELTKYKKLINDWRQAETNEMKGVTKVTATFGLMMTIMNVCAFTAAVVATQYHIANIGTIYLVISYTLNVVSQLWDVSNTTRSYIRIIGDAGPMIDTLEMDIEIKDTESPEKSKICNGKIEFKDVCFTHNQNDDALFRQFNLTVKPGEQIGLIG